MSLKEFQKWVTGNEGVIISDGTLNLEHLLPKVFDLLVTFDLNSDLQREILTVFEIDEGEEVTIGDDVYIVGLFEKQYWGNARLDDHFLEDANAIWNEDVWNYFNEIAPDGYYYGSNEGDSACIGIFKDETQWAECEECGSEQLIADEDIIHDSEFGDHILCEECENICDI